MLLQMLSGMAQGWSDGQKQAIDEANKKDLRKFQIKKFERELDALDQIEQGKQQLLKMLGPVLDASDQFGVMETGQAGMKPGMSLKEALSTPEGAAAAVKAGYKLDDIRQFQTPSITEIIASMQAGNAMGQPGGAIGMPPQGGFEMTGFKVGPNGQVMPDFGRRGEVKRWMTDETGRFEIGVDSMGREVTRRPAAPSNRAEEDKPVPPAQLSNFRNAKGEMPPAGATMRQIREGGYKTTEDSKVAVGDSGKIAMLEQGIKDIDVATSILFPEGQIDKKVLFEMEAPRGGIGKGREVWSLARNAIAGKLRIETGTAAPPAEVDDLARRFLPSPLDLSEPGLAERKMTRLREFLSGSLDITTLPVHVREGIEKRIAANKKKNSGSSKVVDFSALPK